ncbi:DUF202 domain-containing protein [Nocardia lasii]|uniref:DUF202 domain-containing protein n=1 Tax=Nocardia lasii TaxID=1616107 RepID=A0ABW1JTM3_9NOCA
MSASTLAAERTALSWRRTSLATAGCAMIFVHEMTTDSRRTVVLPLVAAVVALILAALAWYRGRSLDRGQTSGGHRPVAATAVGVALVALIAAVAVLVHG